MTITKGVWYKKHVEPSFIQQHLFPFLFFPSSNRGVRESWCSPQALLTAKAVSATNTLLSQHEQTRSRLEQSEGLECRGGELSKWEERRQTSIQRPDALSKVSCRDTALCSSYAITSKVCTAPRVPQPACKGWTGGSRAAGRRSITILIALPRC